MTARWRLFGALLGALIMGSLVAPAAPAQPGERLVLAFYYAWYGLDTWSSGQLADQPLQPYDSRDPAAIRRHVAQAKAAGIDALVQSWYGPWGGVNNMTESNFAALLGEGAKQGLRAAVDLETGSPFFGSRQDVQNALAGLLAGHARHAAYLKVHGRPVVFFWRQQRFSVDEWAAIRQQVDPDQRSIWIAEGDDPAWLRVFDGLHLYSITWRENTNPLYTAAKMRQRIHAYNTQHGVHKLWVATTMPGYDDTHIAGRAGRFAYPRSLDYYRTTWQAAIASQPEMIVITSYNEWLEGTMIEPSVTYGDAYLTLTRELAAAWRAGASTAPTAALTSTAAPQPTAPATATQTATPTACPTPTPTLTPRPSPTPSATPTPPRTATRVPSATPPPAATPAAPPAGCGAVLLGVLATALSWLRRERR